MSGDLIDTTEMYLKTVFELEEAGIPPMRARIAERLGHSGPTVSQTVARMERDDLLHLGEGRRIRLTGSGAARATSVMRKHRLAERHLLDHLGLDYVLLHEEACRWEHVMSREVEQRIAQQIQPPYVDPFGNPIPGLSDLQVTGLAAEQPGSALGGEAIPTHLGELLEDAAEGNELRVRVDRIGEWAQSDVDVLGELARHGVRPGSELTARRVRDGYEIEGSDNCVLDVSERVAGQLAVTRLHTSGA